MILLIWDNETMHSSLEIFKFFKFSRYILFSLGDNNNINERDAFALMDLFKMKKFLY